MIKPTKDVVQEIAKEAAMPDPLEQQLLLTRLRVKGLKAKDLGTIATPPKNLKKPTMKEIDKWKHESRK